jgi:hypothetical protein
LPRSRTGRTLSIALVALALAGAGIRSRAPRPRLDSPEADQFSARNARVLLRSLYTGRPRPLGSADHDALCDRIVQDFLRVGYPARIAPSFACTQSGHCAFTRNVVAVLPGARPDAVLVTAHYDSVAASPGAADDLAAVATILEVARAARATGPHRNTLVFLVSDGEEGGLLGARAFVSSDPLAEAVRVVLNVEARGTEGATTLFETSRLNGHLVPLVARGWRDPVASSLFPAVYRMLPNDTDLTVYLRARREGLNFAMIGAPWRYHTPADSIDHVSDETLAHQGHTIFATARALAGDPDIGASGGAVVFFDLLGWRVVSWPRGWSIIIASCTAFAAIVVVHCSRGAVRSKWRGALRAMAAWWGALILACAVGVGALAVLVGRGEWFPWSANGPLLQLAFCMLGVTAALAPAALMRSSGRDVFLGGLLGWASAALVSNIVFPEGGYLFLIPAGVATLAASLAPLWSEGIDIDLVGLLHVAAAAVVLAPIAAMLYSAVGFPGLPALACAAALLVSPLLPSIMGLPPRVAATMVAVAGALAAGTVALALALPRYSSEVLEPLNIMLLQDGDRSPLWLAGPSRSTLPSTLSAAAKWSEPRANLVPLRPWARYHSTPAAVARMSAAQVSVDASHREGGTTRVAMLRLRPTAGTAALSFVPREPGRVVAIALNGHAIQGPATPVDARGGAIHLLTIPLDGVSLLVEMRGDAPMPLTIWTRSRGLPPSGLPLLRARDAGFATAFQDGDETLVSQELIL